jgi:hypothetical protein
MQREAEQTNLPKIIRITPCTCGLVWVVGPVIRMASLSFHTAGQHMSSLPISNPFNLEVHLSLDLSANQGRHPNKKSEEQFHIFNGIMPSRYWG